ncbi:hypothetical protein PGT21_014590 [Puccinia graminis f. sp. tritici]|uniref:Uncharacterized protein n=1 Tax=Puccinia graminis f. sp. tritici TaxID=56615 RepID=A0A5B0NKV1_PUCGR|nr:hypothetical protein PGT21_014590 [Puccinia graminis f. sp. tritici]KAA1089891.1 hypothetical protein PGTUg99_027120 [Puccinia graminis f. sp. tritici]
MKNLLYSSSLLIFIIFLTVPEVMSVNLNGSLKSTADYISFPKQFTIPKAYETSELGVTLTSWWRPLLAVSPSGGYWYIGARSTAPVTIEVKKLGAKEFSFAATVFPDQPISLPYPKFTMWDDLVVKITSVGDRSKIVPQQTI